MRSFYKGKKVLVIGGAGFIGSHLLDRLISLGAIVTVADNLSSGYMKNIYDVWSIHGLTYKPRKRDTVTETKEGHSFLFCDARDPVQTQQAIDGHDIIFHLAALFGGRGFIDYHPADCCDNFTINTNVIKAAHKAKVERIAFASTACVYPSDLQKDYNSTYLLDEDDAFKDKWASG